MKTTSSLERTANCADNNDDMDSWKSWDEDAVIQKLKENDISESVVAAFSNVRIKGRCLKSLNFYKLMTQLHLSYAECVEVKNFLVNIGCWPTPSIGNNKIFNDPIHGSIQLHPVCLAVIDTPQFQRLRYVKQLGLCYFVYPGAAHNRFEHSLGVCHLAGQFIRTLKDNQPELGIDDNDVLCLELAGLCHDLGHGPFSHVFDSRFIPKVKNRAWKHETASKDMFTYLVDLHGLMKEDGIFRKFGLTEDDMQFVKELMAGPEKLNRGNSWWPYKGRHNAKAYLYEIVANKRNCIDVDKWDYIARDCHQLGIRNNFDHSRFTKFARVIDVHGEMQICVRDKEIVNLYNMFSTRYLLHKIAYQHTVNCALDIMVEQALIKADKHIRIIGKDGKKLKISECINDMAAYTHLTDNILFKILDTEKSEDESDKRSPEESQAELEAARNIIQRIFNRDLFKCIHESQPLSPSDLQGLDEDEIKQQILKYCRTVVTENDLFVAIVNLDFGMKGENPVEKLNTYSKHKPNAAKHLPKEETSRILAPYSFKEQLVRIYVCNRRDETKIKAIKEAYDKWFTDYQFKLKENRESYQTEHEERQRSLSKLNKP
uniref:HD domain-containing protein n=1 Tax=Arion vulgaris TaxID=1028688 RepID=A0A0B7AM80_9EUPU